MKFFSGWSVPNCPDNAFKAVAIEKNRLTGCNLRWGQQDTENQADAARKLAEGKWWRNSLDATISCRDMWDLMLSLGNADHPEGKTRLLTARKPERDDGLTSTWRLGGGYKHIGDIVGTYGTYYLDTALTVCHLVDLLGQHLSHLRKWLTALI